MAGTWIVVTGSLLDTIDGGGGFEFIGPFESEQAAVRYKDRVVRHKDSDEVVNRITLAVELLSPGDWKDRS